MEIGHPANHQTIKQDVPMEIQLIQIQAALSAASSCCQNLQPKKAIPHIDLCIILARSIERKLLKPYFLAQWHNDCEKNSKTLAETQDKIKTLRNAMT